VTSDGKPKVIARYDCSGAGDVDTSTVVTPEGNKIKGLSGRTLVVSTRYYFISFQIISITSAFQIPSTWKNPTQKYHIGLKNAFELYTKNVQKRIEEEKKEKQWDPLHKPLLSKAIMEQQNFNNVIYKYYNVTPVLLNTLNILYRNLILLKSL